jgi:hypothetical protein
MDRIALSCSSLAALAFAHAAAPAAAQGVPVDLELVLAVDVSGSMDPDEHAIQRRGYVEAFTHPDVVGAIRSGPFGRIAVAYVEWGGPASQALTVPWTLVEDLDTAADFAAGLGEASLGRFRGTSISGALTFSAPLFEGNGYDGLRRVVDVSGDGPNNAGAPVVPARDAVVAAGVVVNGLPIALKVPGFSGIGGSDLVAYYRECVIGGPGAFVIPVTEAGQLAEATRQKLVLEIAGLPARPMPAAQGQSVQDAAGSIDCLIGERLRRVWERDP